MGWTSSVSDDRLDRRLGVVDHDIEQQTRIGRRLPAGHPRSTHLSDRVVESSCPVASLPEPPAEDGLVEGSRGLDIGRRDLDVTDLSVCAVGGITAPFCYAPRWLNQLPSSSSWKTTTFWPLSRTTSK